MIKRIIVTSVALLLVCIANSQELDWGKTVGSTGSDYATANCVDMFGNVYTVGTFEGTVDFDPGPGVHNLTASGSADGFVQKLDANGNFVFANYILPGTGTQLPRAVAVSSNGTIYVGGAFSGSVSGPLNATIYSQGLYDGFILSLTSTGSYVGIVPLGSTGNDYVNTVSCNNGAVCAGGTFQGTVDFNPGSGVANLTATGTSGFLARYVSSNGNMTHSWSYVLGTAVNGSEMDASGNIWSTGSYTGTFDFNFSGSVTNLTSAGGNDVFVQKVTATGALTFAKSFGGSGNDLGLGLSYDSNLEVYNSGYFNGTADFDPSANTLNLVSAGGNDAYVSKLTSTGDLVWAKGFGGTGDDQALDVDFDQLYNVYSVGMFNNTVDFDPGAGTTNFTSAGGSDGFVSKLSSAGQFTWVRTIGAASNDLVTGINTSATDRIYLSGYYQGTIDIDPAAGTVNLTSSGSNDAIVARWRPCAIMPSVTNTTPLSSLSICEGNSTTLTATGQGTVSWYSAATGGTYLGSGNNFTTGILNSDTSFYVQDSTCVRSSRIQVDVNVSPPAQNQTVSVANASLCAGLSTTVSIASSELNTIYYLRNDANDTIVTGPVSGTGTALNFSTGPINATTTFNVSAIKTPANNALDLDGANDYVNVGTNNRGITSTMTISARVRATVNGASQFIVSKYLSASLGYYLVISSTGYAAIQGRDVAGGIKASGFSTTMVADTQWHEITGVVRSTGWEIWVDGVMENSGSYSLGASGLGTSASMLVGSFGTTYSPLDIDRLAIWNTAVSGSVIATLPSTCLTGGETNLVAYFPFNESSGTTTADLSVNSLSGTLVNMNSPACWLTGITNQCVNGCEIEMSNTVTVTVSAAPAQPTISPNGPLVICSGGSVTLTSSAGNSYLWSTGATTQSINVSTAGTYTVQVSNGAGCQSVPSAGTVVTIGTSPAQPTISANGPTTFCSGGSVTLTSSAGNSYLWSNGATTSSINVTTGGSYTVQVTNASGCQSVPSAATTVTVNTTPTASIQPASVTICSGTSTTLTASGGGTYAWSNSGGSNAQATFSPSSTTTYTVTVTSGNGCSATASKTVTVNATPTASIQPASVTICSGESATLTASGGGTYAWSNSGGSNAQATFSPSSTTTYTVTVTSGNGCSATASKTVTVNTSPTASIQPASVVICEGESATLTASGGGTYAWSNGLGSGASKTVSPSTTTTYTVTVTSANNCTASASKQVTVNANPTVSVSPSSASICNGSSQQLTASGGGTYAWSNGLGSGASKTVSPSATTTYTVTVTSVNSCTATASATVTVNTVTASINGPTTICAGLQATLTAGGGTSYAWSNGGGSNAQATFSPVSTTTYTVTVTGAGNCTATASQTVSVQSAPTATISGAATVCAGGSVTLTANGGNTYAWANGLGSNATITDSPTGATTYTVTVSIGANCTATASHTVNILQHSSGSISETICQGSTYMFNNVALSQSGSYLDTLVNAVGCDSILTLNLTVTPALQSSFSETICNGSTYTFYNQTLTQSGTYTETVQTQAGCDSIVTLNLTVLAPITTTLNESICANDSFAFNGQQLMQAGQYFDTLSSVNGCDSTITLNLSIDAVPQITTQPSASASTVCAGETVTLSVIASGGSITYQWKENNINEGPDADTYTTGALTAGTKSYTVDVSNNCGSETSNAVSVTVNALPNPTITQTGFDLSTQSFSSYQWQLNGSDINGATSQSYSVTQNGNYTVEVSDANGCTAVSAAQNVTGVGISDIASFQLQLYPNPTTSVITISCDEQIETAEVYNVVGEKVISAKGQITKLNTAALAQGVYTLQLKTTIGNTAVKKFMKQ